MAVILYGTPGSPPCRAVILLAKAIGLELEVKNVDVLEKQENKTEAYSKINPAQTIPALDDNGFHIWESRAIMIYLVEKFAKDDKYYPKDVHEKALVNIKGKKHRSQVIGKTTSPIGLCWNAINAIFFDIGNLHKSLNAYTHPQMYCGSEPSTYKLEQLQEILAMLDRILGEHPFVAGSRLSIADMSLICSVETAKIWRIVIDSAYPNIDKWVSRVKEELPFYNEVTREAIALHVKFIEYRIERSKAK